MNTLIHERRYADGSVGFALQILFVLLILLIVMMGRSAQAATYPYEITPATSIPNPATNVCNYTNINIPVSGNFTITDLNVGLNITHTSRADIDVKLTSPAGTSIVLFTDVGGTGDHFDILLDDSQANDIGTAIGTTNHALASPYYDKLYNPEGTVLLSGFNGQNANGTWVLGICDDASATAGGIVNRIKLDFTGNAIVTTDRGDAPSSYGDPTHTIVAGITLGTNAPDSESASQPTYNATGDGDDEDGAPKSPTNNSITQFPLLKMTDTSYNSTFNVTNTTGTAGKLYGWIDFDKNGTFEADEATSVNVPTGSNNSSVTLNWSSIPTDIKPGTTFIRLRLTTDAAVTTSTPTGNASNGEVEDFPIAIALTLPPNSANVSVTKGSTPTSCTTTVFSDNFNDLAGGQYFAENRPGATPIRNWVASGGGADTRNRTDGMHNATHGTSIYMDSGAIKRIFPAIPDTPSVDSNGVITAPPTAIELRDVADDLTPNTTSGESHWGPSPPRLSRTFNTTVGQRYRLYFDLLPENDGNGWRNGMLRVDTPSGSVHLQTPAGAGSAYQYQVDFTANATTSTISFVNYSRLAIDNNWCEPLTTAWCTIDGLSSTPKTSEPMIDNVVVALEANCVTASNTDYGDAPAAYGNPSHIITDNLSIGNNLDADSSTLQNANADGDDTNGSPDDEDGLYNPPIIPTTTGQTYTLTTYVKNETGSTAYLTAYIDFNRDGDFLDAGERADTQHVYWNNYMLSTFTVPAGTTAGTTYARLRLSQTKAEAESPLGAATSGEVEDHKLIISSGPFYDFGDAPSSYGNPRHTIVNNLFLGENRPDSETASQYSYNAIGDGVDEDGAPKQYNNPNITLFPILKMTATSYSIPVRVTNTTGADAMLYGWIDFDQNGTFDADEVAADITLNNTNGSGTLTWDTIPTDIKLGTTFIRLRLTTDTNVTASTPANNASNGEVEDFPIAVAIDVPPDSPDVTIVRGEDQTCSSTIFTDNFDDLASEQYFGVNTSATPFVIRDWTAAGGGSDTYARTVEVSPFAATQGRSIYFRNGMMRRFYPDTSAVLAFDGNGRMLEPPDAVELRDEVDDVSPGANIHESHWGPEPVTLSRTFASTAGQRYRLYFSAIPEGGDWNSGIMRVDTPSGSVHFKAPGQGEGIQKYRIEFTATGASSTIRFVNYGHIGTDGGWCDPNSVISGPWCTVGGFPTDKKGNELIIDDVAVALASACPSSSISGSVYTDTNGSDTFNTGTESGLANVTVTLYDNNGTTATTNDDSPIATTSTAANGTYSFTNISATPHYRIEVDTRDADLPTSAVIGTTNPLADVAVTAGNTLSNQNFGFDLACNASAGQFGGIAFRDYNQNGIREPQEEGIAGITVTAYNSTNAVAATATTDARGWYTLSGLTNGMQYRLEYTNLPSGLYPGATGTDTASTVRFVTASGSCAANFGISDPIEYCQAVPPVAAFNFVNGNPGIADIGNYASLFTFPYDATGVAYYQNPEPVTKANTSQTGALWGMAYQKTTKTLYASAAMRRFSGLGTLGTGGIYKVDMTNPNEAYTGASAYVDLRAIGIDTGNDVRTPTGCDSLATGAWSPSNDVAAWDKVGKIGVGDIDYDEPNNRLWLVNLNDRKLYGISNVSPTTAPTTANVLGGYAINLPSPYTCTSGTFRPWAVKYHRGYVYVGGVCDAASDPYNLSKVRGYVLRFNPSDAAAGFSHVKDFAINQPRRGFGYTNISEWSGWLPQADAVNVHPQFHSPIVGNLEFDTDSSIIVGIIDRAGLQKGTNAYDEPACDDPTIDYADTMGDVLRLCKTDTGYLSDTEPGCSTAIAANSKTTDEYYWGDLGPTDNAWEGMNEIGAGGLALAPGKEHVLTAAYDANSWGSNGVVWLNNRTGAKDNSYHVSWTTLGKSTGMGELEVLCDPAPIEVGNRVWLDTDKDGIQDAGEAGISNASITLTCGTDTANITTDANGEYYFSNAPGKNATFMGSGESCSLSIANSQASLSGYTLTTQNADGKTDNNSQTDIRDSDAAVSGSNAVINFTVGSSGQNNHGLDFGYRTSTTVAGVAGKVFEDVNYGGGAGRAFGTAGTAGVNGSKVELYSSVGAFISSTTTAADGSYSFSSLAAGNYYVRVVNDTVKSTRTGSNGTERGIQTYRTNGTTANSNEVGGRTPSSVDAAANTTSQTINTTTFMLSGGGQAQSVQPVTVAAANVSGVDFGFNFSTVVNTNDSGQGSLRQGILNINLLDNTGLVQAGQDNTYGINTSVIKEVLLFNIPAASDPLGRTDICGGATCKITLNTQLPAVALQPAIIDATTQPGYVAGTPGVPRIHIVPSAGLDARGFTMGYDAPDSTLRGFAITGFRNLLTNRGITVDSERTLIESNYIGVKPDGAADGNGNGIELQYTQSAVIGGATAAKRNIISANKRLGIFFNTGASGSTIQNNFIGTNPAGTAAMGNETTGIDTEGGSGTKILDNVIAGNPYQGIELGFTSGGPGTTNAIIQGNRIGVGINGEAIGNGTGIINYGVSNGHTIGGTGAGQANTIAHNLSGGISFYNNGSTDITISANSIYANGGLGIDLGFDGITVNDANDADTGANNLLNFPLLSEASISGSNLIIKGCAPENATVELFEADVSVGGKATPGANKFSKSKDYGEGQTYLDHFVEGSAADTDSSNCTLAIDADGNNQTGMKAFTVSIPLPGSIALGDSLTATATLAASGTSEFSPVATIAIPRSLAGKVFEDINYGGGAGRPSSVAGTMGVNGARVELYNAAGTFVSSTTTAADGSYAFNNTNPGNYFVRVVNDTVKSTRTGSNGTERGIQTYRTDGTAAVTGEVGGRKPASVDSAANTTSETLNPATFVLSGGGQAQSIQAVTIASNDISGVNFGFNFSTVINTNDSGQGSLRQAITNANLLANTGMAQPNSTYGFDTTLSKEVLVFNIPAAGDPLGRTDICGGTTCSIIINTKLPNVTAPLIIDGTTQPGYVAGTPGVPRIQISPVAGLTATGIEIHQQANDSTVRGLSLTGFNMAITNTALAIWPSRVVVESNYFGVTPAGTTSGNGTAIALSSGGGAPTTKIRIGGVTPDKRNIISSFSYIGVVLGYSKSDITIQNNFIGTNPAGTAAMTTGQGEGIHVGTSSGVNILDNVISGMAQYAAISINDDGAPYGHEAPLLPIVIQGNRIGVGINGENIGNTKEGILNVGTPNPVQIGGAAAGQANTIAYNALGGVIYTNTSDSSVNTISRNSIYANGRLGIDLGRNMITLNDTDDADTGANNLLNFPMLSKLTLIGGNLTIKGCAPAGATVELFEADVSVGGTATPGNNTFGKSKDYGEGQIYLHSFVEGGADDTNTANCTLPTDVDGNDQTGMKGFTVTITPAPAGFVIGDSMTATATVTTSGTSEFSPAVVLPEVRDIAGKVFEDVNYGGGNGRAFNAATLGMAGISGATLELYDDSNTLIASTTTDSDGNYVFKDIAVGVYSVQVMNASVRSTRPGSNGSERGVITHRTDGVGNTVNAAGTTFSQTITLSTTNLSNVSFGFNFDTITNTNDSGAGSLRQFLLNANLLGGDATLAQVGLTAGKENAILELSNSDPNYNTGYWSIPLQSALPTITAPIVLDGALPHGSNSNPVLELQGTGAGGTANGLTLNTDGSGSTIRKLAINGFGGAGIYLDGSNDNSLLANHIGVTPSGIASGNTGSGIRMDAASANKIGSTANGEGNIITNNTGNGITITGSDALLNSILGNSIYANGGLGIDLVGGTEIAGVTTNDDSDNDDGPNSLLNYPDVKVNSFGANGTKIVTYDFNLDLSAGDYRLEFFVSTAPDASGHGEGQTFIGSKDINHPGTGVLNFKGTFNANVTVAKGTFISATLTQKIDATTFGSTSEFSGIKDGITTQVCDSLITGTADNMVIDETNAATIIQLLEAKDSDGNPITYVISGGADGNFFTIVNPTPGATLDCATVKFLTSNVIITKSARDNNEAETRATLPGSLPPAGNYELPLDKDQDNVYELQITATAADGKKYVRDLNVRVMDTNEAPGITSASLVLTNEDSNADVMMVQAQDPDVGDKLTYRISSGADSSHFEINATTGILRFRAIPDYDAPMDANRDNTYEIEITVTDKGGLSSKKLFQIRVVNNTADDGVVINVRALLQGPYDNKTALMSADLNTLGLLPSKHPYQAFGHTGTETLSTMLKETTGNNAVVDWALVELRTSPSSVVASRAVILQRDGDLVDAQTGSPNLHFANIKAGNYYVSVRHRNHLGVVSASPVSLDSSARMLDFAASSTVVRGEESRLVSGKLAWMWAGDINGSHTLTANGPGNDVTSLLSGVITSMDNLQGNTNHILSGYLATDLNFDGKTLFTGPGNDTSLLVGNILLHPLNTGFAANYIVKGGLQ